MLSCHRITFPLLSSLPVCEACYGMTVVGKHHAIFENLWYLSSHEALAAAQYSCRGGVIDSKGELVCVYASTTWPSAVLPFSCYLFALWPSPELIHLFGRAANTSFLSITLYLTLSWLKCSERSPLSPVRPIWYEHYCYSKLFGHSLYFFFHSHIHSVV